MDEQSKQNVKEASRLIHNANAALQKVFGGSGSHVVLKEMERYLSRFMAVSESGDLTHQQLVNLLTDLRDEIVRGLDKEIAGLTEVQ